MLRVGTAYAYLRASTLDFPQQAEHGNMAQDYSTLLTLVTGFPTLVSERLKPRRLWTAPPFFAHGGCNGRKAVCSNYLHYEN